MNGLHFTDGGLTSLEEAISDKDKQIAQLREQRDRAERERNEERDLHERQLAEQRMKLHTHETEMNKLQVCVCPKSFSIIGYRFAWKNRIKLYNFF